MATGVPLSVFPKICFSIRAPEAPMLAPHSDANPIPKLRTWRRIAAILAVASRLRNDADHAFVPFGPVQVLRPGDGRIRHGPALLRRHRRAEGRNRRGFYLRSGDSVFPI